MLEYSYFATISPEGCASILWKSADQASKAAEIMGITARKLLKIKMVDQVIPEPVGGAHRHYQQMADSLKTALSDRLTSLMQQPIATLQQNRYQRFMNFGQFSE